MNPHVFDRGRSERFAELLDEANGRRRRHRYSDLDAELNEYVRLTDGMRRVQEAPETEHEFRTGLRTMLMAKITREGIGIMAEQTVPLGRAKDPVRQLPAGAGKARMAMLLGAVIGAVLLSGVSVASTDALPGDPLYQVKRSSERAQLALAGSDVSRGQLYLQFALGRLTEAKQVDEALLGEVFADMDAETLQGASVLAAVAAQKGETATLNTLLRFVAQQRQRILDLRLPDAGTQLSQTSLALLDAVEARATELGSSLRRGCHAGPIDSLGPKPGC